MRPTKSSSVPAPHQAEYASGRDELTAEIGMDRQRLALCREGPRAAALGGGQEQAAREFYEGVLGGRQVWPTGPRAAPRKIWFLIGTTLVPVSLTPTRDVVELCVDSPAAIAEQCWDAGYSVRLRTNDPDDFIVTDPFGRQIVLIRRTSVCPVVIGVAG